MLAPHLLRSPQRGSEPNMRALAAPSMHGAVAFGLVPHACGHAMLPFTAFTRGTAAHQMTVLCEASCLVNMGSWALTASQILNEQTVHAECRNAWSWGPQGRYRKSCVCRWGHCEGVVKECG